LSAFAFLAFGFGAVEDETGLTGTKWYLSEARRFASAVQHGVQSLGEAGPVVLQPLLFGVLRAGLPSEPHSCLAARQRDSGEFTAIAVFVLITESLGELVLGVTLGHWTIEAVWLVVTSGQCGRA